MKRQTLLALTVALAALPAGALAGQSDAPAAPPPSPAALEATGAPLPPGYGELPVRSRVIALRARARVQARRLGLRADRRTSLPVSPRLLTSTELRLTRVIGFLAHRRELGLAVDERSVALPHRARHARASRLAREFARVARMATRLGIDHPTMPRPAHTAQGRASQIARWRTVARWLAARSERLRPDERPLGERIPHLRELLCIAGHESRLSWTIATGNGYYGGLQMDRGFQQTYAPALYRTKGTADHWSAAEQMQAAERAIATRGFTPWPNTGRACGLL